MSLDGRHHPGEGPRPTSSLVGRICQACVRSLPVAGAAVSVMTAAGHRGVVFATDETSTRLEDLQFSLGQGPGVEAFGDGHAILIADLGAARRWPLFTAAALALDVASMFAFPLYLGAATLGAMTLYRREPGELDGPDLARAVRLGEAAAYALLDLLGGISAADIDDADGPDQVTATSAEFLRSEVYQAAGMVMGQLEVNIETAMVRLRAYAFSTGRTTAEVAHEIVAGKLRMQPDNG